MSIFEFIDFREYIRFRVSRELYTPSGRKRSNLERVSRGLGYSSPSLLSMVINGQRVPSDDFCEAVGKAWNLSLKEREYLRLLIRLAKKQKLGEDTSEITAEIRKSAQKRSPRVFMDIEFSMIREWHFLVIKQLVETPGFRDDPTWISRALRKKVTPSQAKRALEVMEEVGILRRDPETGRLKVFESDTETTHNIPSSALREHQTQMMYRAIEAIEEQPVEQRFFNSLTFNVDRNRLPELQRHFLEFMRGVNAEYSAHETDSVCQLNLQFFEHTAPKKGEILKGEVSNESIHEKI